jgi:predicted GNAT family N-acyltransferase
MEIIELSQRKDLLDTAVQYIWRCWGNECNIKFYENCIYHAVDEMKPLPKFYLGLIDNEIIASYALLTNDIISRQDLFPWFACLYVNEEHRNKGLASRLLHHGLQQTAEKKFDYLYLSTDLENFYEKYGWSHYTNGFNIVDTEIKIYRKATGIK